MKKTLKKILNMTEKETGATEQEVAVEQEKITDNQPETTPEEDKIRELEKQLDESRNKYLYLYSDFENLKRHAARDRMELIQTAGRDIMTALLDVLDDFDRAYKNDALDEGMTLIHQKFVNTLKAKGLTSLETKPGDEFDADRHEAVAEIPAPSEEMKGKIVDILEPGYALGERIIRFAKVVVGK